MEAIYRPIQMTFREPIIIAVNLYIGMSTCFQINHVEEELRDTADFRIRICVTLLLFRVVPPSLRA
jgi:hypothetical protein